MNCMMFGLLLLLFLFIVQVHWWIKLIDYLRDINDPSPWIIPASSLLLLYGLGDLVPGIMRHVTRDGYEVGWLDLLTTVHLMSISTFGIGFVVMIYQGLTYRFYALFRNRTLLVTMLLIPTVGWGIFQIYHSLPSVRAQEVLTRRHLATLPNSASRIHFTRNQGGRDMDYTYIRFEASQEDIHDFLVACGAYDWPDHRDYQMDQHRVALQPGEIIIGEALNPDIDYFQLRWGWDSHQPHWYSAEILTGGGSYYPIPTVLSPPYQGEIIYRHEDQSVCIGIFFDG